MALRGKQKSFLRSQAHHLNPVVQIGKNGISETLLDQVDELLERRELIKVTLLQNTDEEASDVAAVLEEKVGCSIAQIIGRILVVYKPSSKEKNQAISNELAKL